MPAFTIDINDDVSGADALALYDSVGWSAYTREPAVLTRAIQGSSFVVTARDPDGALVGLARAISDDATSVPSTKPGASLKGPTSLVVPVGRYWRPMFAGTGVVIALKVSSHTLLGYMARSSDSPSATTSRQRYPRNPHSSRETGRFPIQ